MAEQLTEQDRDRIRAFYDTWTEQLFDDDYEGMLELYTDDAVMLPPNAPAVRGKDAILSSMRTFPSVTRAEFVVEEIDGCGDVAYVMGRYSMTLEPEGAPGPVDDRGKYIEIRRRQPDGSWHLSRDIFNSDLPPQRG